MGLPMALIGGRRCANGFNLETCKLGEPGRRGSVGEESAGRAWPFATGLVWECGRSMRRRCLERDWAGEAASDVR